MRRQTQQRNVPRPHKASTAGSVPRRLPGLRLLLLVRPLSLLPLLLAGASLSSADVLTESRERFLAGDRIAARDLLAERIREVPSDADAHLAYAFVRSALGERDEVRAEYMSRVQEEPGDPVFLVTFLSVSPSSLMKTSAFEHMLADHPEFVQGWEEWGRDYLANWKPEEAIGPLEKAVALSPDRARSLLYLGIAHRTLGNFVKEIRYLGRAFESDSLDPQVRAEWAFTILDRGDPEMALRVITPVLEAGIEDDYPSIIAAVAHASLGDTDEFARRRAEARERNPGCVDDLIYRGIRFRDIANGREAERMFRLAITLEPDHATAGIHLGVLQMSRGSYADARETFVRVVETPDGRRSTAVWKNLGLSAARLGAHAEAVARFDSALAIDPKLVAVRAERARSLTTLGRYADAADEWERVIDLDPRGWIANEARRAVLHLREGKAPPPAD